ncbi:peptidyl-prolyl cis-trans isomerase CYP26-2, chloroplastic-like isoform X2 [Prosopis cineraria]|uniref:peptidyl-prolyl cis-trans isomerase CYP26-2, chloroplastic-like isoform X2 n=1 Tax=Prosopis cineraria TaxID=364024 RepID=UPI00240F1E72|nr:peptidyl-prolyl cis-trans isomerase CYP26-2, chloroplastic-like isoform X2 [Prosopis cineraria]
MLMAAPKEKPPRPSSLTSPLMVNLLVALPWGFMEMMSPLGLTEMLCGVIAARPLKIVQRERNPHMTRMGFVDSEGLRAKPRRERFTKIVNGTAGISYRRKEFIKIMPNYVQHGGVRSYGADAEAAKRTGSNLGTESLVEEWERTYEGCAGTKNLAGSVAIIVRDPSKPPPKLKLVARKGKLEIDQEEVGVEPNGTEFVIATKDSPELDASALVIGRVVEGVEVVKRIAQVKTVQENTGSPYFRVAKLIGDKRAVVAERGFNRPYSKVVVTNCGVLG